jgi:hypothetical protein
MPPDARPEYRHLSWFPFLHHHAMPRIIELGVHETGGFRDAPKGFAMRNNLAFTTADKMLL